MLRLHRTAPVPDASELSEDVPPPVGSLLAEAMDKDPRRRPADAADFAARLESLLDGERTSRVDIEEVARARERK